MPNVYSPLLLQIRPQYTTEADGDTPENVFWLIATTNGPYSKASLQAMCGVWDPLWANVWQNLSTTGAYYTGSICTDWTTSTGLSYSSVGTYTPAEGDGSGTLQPSQVCALISWQISERYRGGHFRTYLPYLTSGVIATPTTLTSTEVTSMTSRLNSLMSGLIGATPTGIGGTYLAGYRFRDNPATARLWTFESFTVQPKLATQRRRLRKVAHR